MKRLQRYRESEESPTAATTVAAASAGDGSVPGDYVNIFEDAASSREGSAYVQAYHGALADGDGTLAAEHLQHLRWLSARSARAAVVMESAAAAPAAEEAVPAVAVESAAEHTGPQDAPHTSALNAGAKC